MKMCRVNVVCRRGFSGWLTRHLCLSKLILMLKCWTFSRIIIIASSNQNTECTFRTKLKVAFHPECNILQIINMLDYCRL